MVTPASISELAHLTRARLIGDGSWTVSGVGAVSIARADQICFLRTARFAAVWPRSNGAAAVVSERLGPESLYENDPRKRPLLVVAEADVALVALLNRFAPAEENPPSAGIHPSSLVHPSAVIAPSAHIGPGCIVRARARIDEDAVLLAQVYLGEEAAIGAGSRLHPGVRVLDRCRVGARCTLFAGSVIGSEGFGFARQPDAHGPVRFPHIGNVVIDDHVDIGANSCVDRAKFGSTTIGAGTKIDNLVQIGHGCTVGRFCVICGQCGLAGSVTLGEGVVLGGRVAVTDHVTIGDGAHIGGTSGVAADVPAGGAYLGSPAEPATDWKRGYAAMKSLGRLLPQIRMMVKKSGLP